MLPGSLSHQEYRVDRMRRFGKLARQFGLKLGFPRGFALFGFDEADVAAAFEPGNLYC